jgi:hypothetical protein
LYRRIPFKIKPSTVQIVLLTKNVTIIMKKLFFAVAILFGCLTFKVADAQIRLNLGVNIGDQPEWGPVGYDHVEYYYVPGCEAYYYVPGHYWIYWGANTNQWVHSRNLPQGKQRNFDAYGAYKVVLNEPTPWLHHRENIARYNRFVNRRDQVVIRDSHDDRYRNHWVEH